MFGVIVAAIAFYLRLSKKKDELEDIAYEKSMA